MLRRSAFALVLGAFLSTNCIALPMTCEDFKQRLAQKIEDDGHKVAIPDPQIAYDAKDHPHKRYSFKNIVGLSGDLNCVENDSFDNVDGFAHIDADDEEENGLRIKRLLSLASASLCASTNLALGSCTSRVHGLFNKAFTEMQAAKKRGEQDITQDEYFDIPGQVQVDIGVAPGTVSFGVFQKH